MNNMKISFSEFINESYDVESFANLDNIELKMLINSKDIDFDDYQFNNALVSLKQLQKVIIDKEDITLYRLISADSIDDINKKELGIHYTSSVEYFKDPVTLFDIGIDTNKNLYLITITTNSYNIDLDTTITNNIFYPFENEVTINDQSKVKIQSIEQYNIKK